MSRNEQKDPRTPPATSKKSPSRSPGTRPSSPPADARDAGLDRERHARAQQIAQEAEILRQAVVPASLATAIRLDQVSASGYRAHLDRLLKDAGNPTDPIEVMMLEQLAMAHFRIAQLHAGAGQAQGIEAVKILSSAAARLLGEFRRTALAIRSYRDGVPEDKSEKKIKIHKVAQ